MSACCYSNSGGLTCKFPGVLTTSLHGGGRWFCIWHWRLMNEGHGPSDARFHGDAIVQQSFEWDQSAEGYRAMRHEAQKKKPGMDAHARGKGVADLPAAVGEVEGAFRISECLPELDELYSRQP